MSQVTVRKILREIKSLSKDDRKLLEQSLARQEEAEWAREAAKARRLARKKHIDQSSIDKAIQEVRYSS